MNSDTSAPIREQARERLGMTARPVPFRQAPIVGRAPVNDPVMEINRPQPFRPTSESIRQTPAPAARARQARSGSVLVGAWKMFMSALPGIFSPMTFFFHQRLVLWKAVVYATVPLLMAVLFYLVVPGQIAAYPLSNLSGWAYLAALFVASQIVFCLFLGLCHGIGAAVLAFANTARSHDRR